MQQYREIQYRDDRTPQSTGNFWRPTRRLDWDDSIDASKLDPLPIDYSKLDYDLIDYSKPDRLLIGYMYPKLGYYLIDYSKFDPLLIDYS